MKKILVTGGFGFLGSHLVEELVKNPDNLVYVVDNLSTSPIDYKQYLLEIGQPKNLNFDICSVADFSEKNKEKFDQIYHLASVVGPAGVLNHAGKIIKSIVDDAYRLIDLALSSGAKLVDISTSEIYGGGKEGYCKEDLQIVVPPKTTIRLEYAVGKLAVETALINTSKVTDLDVAIVRPFNISGPRQSGRGGFVLPRFIKQAFEQKPITVFGKGSQIRAFTHVKDMAQGIIKTMEKGKRGEAYNIGNANNKITILELAEKVIKAAKSKSRIDFVDPKKIYGPFYEEAADKFPDAKKALVELGWEPKYNIDRVIFDTIEYFKSHKFNFD